MEMKVAEISAQEALISKIQPDYNEIIRLYRSVPVTAVEQDYLTNNWSVKDILSHIAAWEWRCASLLDASHETNTLLLADPDVDALNREIYEERREWSWEEIEYDFRASHRALLEAIDNLPPERLDDSFVQEMIAENTWLHYAEHLPDLRRWHKRQTRNR